MGQQTLTILLADDMAHFLDLELSFLRRADCKIITAAAGSRTPATHASVDQRLHYLKMNGGEVFKLATRIMADAAARALAQCGLTAADVTCVIPHQANLRIISAVMARLDVPMEKVYLNVDKYGNMSAASTIVALCEAVQAGRIRRGDTALLVAFGAGLAWGALVIRW